jgi:hypothetical protein
MRLVNVLHCVPKLARRVLPLAAVTTTAVIALCGCSVLDSVSTGNFSVGSVSAAPSYNPSIYYLATPEIHRVSREYTDRYACATGAPLMCVCTSRHFGDCDCHC